VIRLLGRILLIALLALLGALPGEARDVSAAPAVESVFHDRVDRAEPGGTGEEPRLDSEPAEGAESTDALEEPPRDDSAGVLLERPASEVRLVVAPTFERAALNAPAQAAPPAVDRETPTRPPRG
jgi:hypothetical protein